MSAAIVSQVTDVDGGGSMTWMSPLFVTAMLACSDIVGMSCSTVVSVCNAIFAVVTIVYRYVPGVYVNFHGPLGFSSVCTFSPGLTATAGIFAAGFDNVDGVVTIGGCVAQAKVP